MQKKEQNQLRPQQLKALQEMQQQKATQAAKPRDRAYIHESGAWRPITDEDLLGLTIGELLKGEKRVVWSVTLKYGKAVYLSVTESDRDSLRKKYPNAPIVCLSQIAGLFKHDLSADNLEKSFLEFLSFIHMAPEGLEDSRIAEVKDGKN